MKLNIATVVIIIGAVSLCGAGISYATEHEKHVTEALTHAHAAVDAGQKGTANTVGQHARQALEHAKQAENVQPDALIKPDPHITEAETHLSQAIDHAATGHADIATKHVQEAIRHLRVAYQADQMQ
ncbi:MAG: small metal-binding protein SmbP [Gammaproteobacteria bacterium]